MLGFMTSSILVTSALTAGAWPLSELVGLKDCKSRQRDRVTTARQARQPSRINGSGLPAVSVSAINQGLTPTS